MLTWTRIDRPPPPWVDAFRLASRGAIHPADGLALLAAAGHPDEELLARLVPTFGDTLGLRLGFNSGVSDPTPSSRRGYVPRDESTQNSLPSPLFAAGADRARATWRDAGREGEPRLAALAYVSLGADSEGYAHRYLRDYYSFLGDIPPSRSRPAR